MDARSFNHGITWNTLYQHLYRLLVANKRLRVPLGGVQLHGTRQQASSRLQGSGGHFQRGIPNKQIYRLCGLWSWRCFGHMFTLHQEVEDRYPRPLTA